MPHQALHHVIIHTMDVFVHLRESFDTKCCTRRGISSTRFGERWEIDLNDIEAVEEIFSVPTCLDFLVKVFVVDAMMRTSTDMGIDMPTGVTSLSSIARRSFTWR